MQIIGTDFVDGLTSKLPLALIFACGLIVGFCIGYIVADAGSIVGNV